MISLKTSLSLAALAVAILATPALAATKHRHLQPQQTYDYSTPAPRMQEVYPNGAVRSGSEASFESGAEFNLLQQPAQ